MTMEPTKKRAHSEEGDVDGGFSPLKRRNTRAMTVWGRLESTSGHIDLVSLPTTIGRSTSRHVRLLSPGISNSHAEISPLSTSTVLVHDLSKNGTYLRGRIIGYSRAAVAFHGDTISFGMSPAAAASRAAAAAAASAGHADGPNAGATPAAPAQATDFVLHLNFEGLASVFANSAAGASATGAVSPDLAPASDSSLDMRKFFHFYEPVKHLGSGHFADVFLATHRLSGRQVAVKAISLKPDLSASICNFITGGRERPVLGRSLSDASPCVVLPSKVARELSVLARLSHPGLIRTLDFFVEPPSSTRRELLEFLGVRRGAGGPAASDPAVADVTGTLYLVMEYAPGGELYRWITAKNERRAAGAPQFPEAAPRVLFRQLLEAVVYLHSQSIVHRDLKPENILLLKPDFDATPGWEKAIIDPRTGRPQQLVWISDFGLARELGEMEALQGLSGSEAPEMAPGGAPAATETADISREYQQLMTSICGTPLYLAPDVLEHGRRLMNGINFNIQTGRVRQDDRDKVIRTLNSDDGIMLGGGYSAAVDMWSLGVTLYILLVGYPPFHPQPGPNQLRLNDQIRTSEIVFHQPYWDTISDQAKNLVLGLLNRDPKKRLTARQALAHPWFST